MQGEPVNTWDATGLSKESSKGLGVHAESEDPFDRILNVGVVQEDSVSPPAIFELLALSTPDENIELEVHSDRGLPHEAPERCVWLCNGNSKVDMLLAGGDACSCIVERLKALRQRVSGTTDCAFSLPRGVLSFQNSSDISLQALDAIISGRARVDLSPGSRVKSKAA